MLPRLNKIKLSWFDGNIGKTLFFCGKCEFETLESVEKCSSVVVGCIRLF